MLWQLAESSKWLLTQTTVMDSVPSRATGGPQGLFQGRLKMKMCELPRTPDKARNRKQQKVCTNKRVEVLFLMTARIAKPKPKGVIGSRYSFFTVQTLFNCILVASA